ncbi:zinc finger BED domain-containing protein 1 isoform X2 [Python bivittatus]|uniref:Polyprenol dehydrogenase n=1 Tax=Python bivittatus TaxID=176946 RepID=A0A9F5MQT9_PYTBI|nr:zinc finger BED domain-containing protein 1 isoform X2 [Python bivittatus]
MENKTLETSPSDLKLVAHPRAKSKVWKYFGFDTNAEGCILQWKKIYCRICMAQIAYSGNTSNLSYHLEKNHPDEFCEFVKSNTEQMREAFATAFSKLKPESSQQVVQDNLIMKTSHSYENKKHQELTSAVISLICEGLYPPSIVDEPTFKSLLRTADPRYELPCRKYFCTKGIPEKYVAVRDIVLKELMDVPWCGISTDIWRSDNQNRSYVTLSVHFISNGSSSSLAINSRCLKTFEVPEENTAETITRVLYEIFIEWGINTKVFGATTDYGKDVVKACSLLDIPVQMPCLGQTFNVGIQQAFQLPKLSSVLSRCRKLVEYFQQSAVAMYMLSEKQQQQNILHCMLVSDRVSWWGSTLAMLQRLKEQQFVIAAVLVEDSNNHHLMLEASEWNAIEGLVDLLQPFKQVAEMISASKYPRISMVKPLLHMLLNTTLNIKENDSKEISMAKEVIAKELSATYQHTPEIDMFLNVATFLDPRYKKLPFLSAFEKQQVENRVLEDAKSILEKIKENTLRPEEKFFAVSEEPPVKKVAVASTPPPTSAINNMLAEIFCQTGGVEDQEEWHAQIIEELSNFKSQKVLGLSEDPLKWWSDRLALFPVLPKVLQKYWCIVATRVFPERLFSSSANVVSAKRNRLAPAHVDEQVFLYENARILPLQSGRVAIVTGGIKGIGYHIAKELARLGMHVIIVANDEKKGHESVMEIKEEILNAKVEFLYCDLASMKSVCQCVKEFKAKNCPLHVLINNAAVMLVPEKKTEDGFEEHIGVNYLGHFLLINLLLDTLKQSGTHSHNARIVTVSSAAHYAGELRLHDLQSSCLYSPYGAYAQSKLALVLFSYRLQHLLTLEGSHVTANAVDPGLVNTDLYQNLCWALKIVKWMIGWLILKTPEEGASTSIYAAVSPELEGVGGCYLYNEQRTKSSDISYDEELQKRLWTESCRLVGIPDVVP